MNYVLCAGRFATGVFLLSIGSAAYAMDTRYPANVAPLALTTNTYTQNFSTLAASGTSNALPAGWQAFEGGTNANGTYVANNGSSNAGTIYSYGDTGSTDRALGSLASGTVDPIYYGAVFSNGLSSAITGLTFGYVGEQWRAADANDSLTFQYSLDAAGVTGGTWTTISSLTFTSPNGGTTGAINGNLATNQQLLSGSLTGLSIANGTTFAVRWFDQNAAGSDDGLAVDNFTLSAFTAPVGAVPEPGTWALMLTGFGLAGAALRRPRPAAAMPATA